MYEKHHLDDNSISSLRSNGYVDGTVMDTLFLLTEALISASSFRPVVILLNASERLEATSQFDTDEFLRVPDQLGYCQPIEYDQNSHDHCSAIRAKAIKDLLNASHEARMVFTTVNLPRRHWTLLQFAFPDNTQETAGMAASSVDQLQPGTSIHQQLKGMEVHHYDSLSPGNFGSLAAESEKQALHVVARGLFNEVPQLFTDIVDPSWTQHQMHHQCTGVDCGVYAWLYLLLIAGDKGKEMHTFQWLCSTSGVINNKIRPRLKALLQQLQIIFLGCRTSKRRKREEMQHV